MQNLTFVLPLILLLVPVVLALFIAPLLAALSKGPRPNTYNRDRRTTSVWLRLARRLVK